jgi:hypothetical protein
VTEQEYENALIAMRRYGGGFVSALAEAWIRADVYNRTTLANAFPELLREYDAMAKERGI